jgi:hypothetical protein
MVTPPPCPPGWLYLPTRPLHANPGGDDEPGSSLEVAGAPMDIAAPSRGLDAPDPGCSPEGRARRRRGRVGGRPGRPPKHEFPPSLASPRRWVSRWSSAGSGTRTVPNTPSATPPSWSCLIKPQRPWRSPAQVELAAAEWTDWYNHTRLHGEIGHIPPAEYEANHYRNTTKPRVTTNI